MTSTSKAMQTLLNREQVIAMERAADQWLPAPQASVDPNTVRVVAVSVHKCDGVRYFPGQQYQLERSRAVAAHARGVVYIMGSEQVDWFQMPDRILSPWASDKERPFSTEPLPGSLRIVSGCGYDPGSQGYRFHSAINQHSKHASVFVRWQDSNPFSSFRQLDGERDAPKVREAILSADVIHCHINFLLLQNSGLTPQPGQLLVRHYHGSLHPGDQERLGRVTWLDPKWDKARNAVMVGARLTFYQEAEELAAKIGEPVDIDWLPITVPVARYRKLSKKRPASSAANAFRIAHCPTRQAIKGTKEFLKVVDTLNTKGLAIIPVLMTDLPQAEALARKRTCDATFDSDWLGLQTSGLEAGAMGQPCIAGDRDVKALHEKHIGYCPYTFFDSSHPKALEEAIERLAVDRDHYRVEAERLSRFVVEYHDYPAVARRYEQILAKHLKRDDVLTTSEPKAA